MPPRKNLTAEEGGELKEALDLLTAEVAIIKKQQETIMRLVLEVQQLKDQSVEKDQRIQLLEDRVSEMEQYSRINDIIVTGIKIKPRSYAKAATVITGNDEPCELDAISVEKQVAVFLETKGIDINCNDIEACHTLPRRNATANTTAVIMRFVNRKSKTALLKQGKKLKGSDVYLNEHLTKRNADIAKKARFMRKSKKIQSTWTTNCKVFIKTIGTTPEEEKVVCIRKMEDLDKYQ